MEGAFEGNALAVRESEESDLDALERREVVDVEVCLDDDEEVRVEGDELRGLGGEADGVFALGVRGVCGEYLGVREVRREYLGVRGRREGVPDGWGCPACRRCGWSCRCPREALRSEWRARRTEGTGLTLCIW